jgi:hypothetical protein
MLNLFINSLLVTLLLWESPVEKTVHEKRQQALVYDIIRGKEKIGTVVAVRIINGETSASRIETHSELRMVFTIKVDIVARNTFKNQVLTESHVKKEVNGAVRTNNSVFLDDSVIVL